MASGDELQVGFACHWDRRPESTWSGTPWNLREQLRELRHVVDLDVGPPVPARALLKAAGMRRADGQWQSLWRHGRVHTRWVERDLRARTSASGVDVVVQIQDLGDVPVPFLLVQDLSYRILIEQYGAHHVPHFRTLGRDRLQQLNDRQLGIYQRAAALLPTSEWMARDLVSSGVPRERIHVVNPGVNAGLPPDTPVPERRNGPARRLLLVGRDFDTKGGDIVVAAFALLRKQLGPGIELTVIGPPEWPLAGPVPPGVTFLGPQSRERVAEALDTHDLFVMPSRLEGFGIAFVEALVRGLPCVGRDACAMPEIIGDDGGRLVRGEEPEELAEVVMSALEDDDLYRACAAAAPARRAHYTWRRAARQVSDAISHVMQADA